MWPNGGLLVWNQLTANIHSTVIYLFIYLFIHSLRHRDSTHYTTNIQNKTQSKNTKQSKQQNVNVNVLKLMCSLSREASVSAVHVYLAVFAVITAPIHWWMADNNLTLLADLAYITLILLVLTSRLFEVGYACYRPNYLVGLVHIIASLYCEHCKDNYRPSLHL